MLIAGLVKQIIKHNLSPNILVEKGINESLFLDKDERKVLDFLRDFKAKYNKLPSIETVSVECNLDILLRVPNEPVDYWIDSLRERRKQIIISELFQKIQENRVKGNSLDEIKLINDAYSELRDLEQEYIIKDLYKLAEEAIEEHYEIQLSGKEIYGIPFGLPTLDELTGGMREGDFIFIVGETGVNKSYLSLFFGLSAYENGYNVLCVSPEMAEKQIGRRGISLLAHTSDSDFKKGRLSYYAIKKLQAKIKEMKSRENWFKILPSGMFTDIHNILINTVEMKPDLLIVDGIYLIKNSKLRTTTHWKEDESIIFLLRELALREKIPIICTTQYSRRGRNKKDGARGTQSVEQTATLFLSLEFENKEDREISKPKPTRKITIKKGRDGERMTLSIQIDFDKTEITEVPSNNENISNMIQETIPKDNGFFNDSNVEERIEEEL